MKILLFVIALFVLFPLPSYAQKSSDTAVTKIGSPKEGSSGWPTTGSVNQGPRGGTSHNRIASNFGGLSIDIGNIIGTPIYATFDGTAHVIDFTGTGADAGYGNIIKLELDSPAGAFAYYAHLSGFAVTDKERVKKGQLIGYMGNTSKDPIGPHLHYELRGIPFSPPYVPQQITPESCDPDKNIPCSPSSVSSSEADSPQSSSWPLNYFNSPTNNTPYDPIDSYVFKSNNPHKDRAQEKTHI